MPKDVIAALQALPERAIDFTVPQLRLILQAFGKDKLSHRKKGELTTLLKDALAAGSEFVNVDKVNQLRHLILDM